MSTIYFVECDFGKRGTAFVETDPDRNSRNQVVRDIAGGEHCDVLRVIAADPDEHTCDDITEDIAREVYDLVSDNGEGVPKYLEDFLEREVGIPAVNALRKQWEAA